MTITKSDWRCIYDTMRRYKRKEGFVDEVDGSLLFFDSDPCIKGIHACHVTIEEVKEYMDYDTDNDI